jgi:hypothetical protein
VYDLGRGGPGEQPDLRAVAAALLPQGRGEAADELGLELGGRRQLFNEAGEQLVVGGAVLAREQEVPR